MQLPKCYDPIYQAERREAAWDAAQHRSRSCSLCRCSITPGNPYRECFSGIVCQDCFEELEENVRMDVDY